MLSGGPPGVGWGGVEPMVRPSRLTFKEILPRMLGRVHMGARLIPIGRDSSCSFSKPSVLMYFSPLLSLASNPEIAPETWMALESLEHYLDHSLPGLIRISF